VIRRVFHDEGSLLSGYLDSFMPQSAEKLETLAAWFIVSLARITAISAKNKTGKMPGIINALGERYAPIAETLGLERAVKSANVIQTVVTQSGNFNNDSFSRFMKICMEMVSTVTRLADDPQYIVYNDIFKKYITETVTAVEILNINKTIALESLFYNLKKNIIRGLHG
jgi:flagellar hook-associated protein FlgK